LLALCPLAFVTGCGASKEKAIVSIEYSFQPDKGLPPGMKALAVMQLDAQSEGTAGSEFDENKWQEIVAEMMHRRITVANEKHNLGIVMADRASTKDVMKEKDLAMSGMADGAEIAEASKLLGVQGLIRGRVIVKIDKQEGKGRTMKATSVFASVWGGGGSMDTEESSAIRRTITVTPSFRLVDAGTSKDWFTWAPDKPFMQSEAKKPGFFFGSGQTEADLDPRDEIIAMCVEDAIVEFLSHIIPVDYDFKIELESSGNEACAMGVKLIRGEDYEGALSQFDAALLENPEDDRAAFAAGVVNEKLGKYPEALKYYKKACVVQQNPVYTEARDRVKSLMARAQAAEG
jgi:hypothetical protein